MRALILSILISTPAWAVTYEEVEPIFRNRCQQCHQHMADKNWGKEENAESVRLKIRLRVENGTMPPPPMPITEEERELILKWTKE